MRILNSAHAQVASTLISSTVANLSVIAGTALLVRHLGGEGYGRVSLLTTAASAISILPASGIGLHILRSSALVQDTQEHFNLLRASIWASQGIAAVIGLGIILLGGIFSDRSAFELVFVAIILQLITADSIYKSAMIGAQRLHALAIATVVGTTSSVVFQLVGSFLYGPEGFIGGFLVGTGSQALSSRLGCGKTQTGRGLDGRTILTDLRMTESRKFIGLATLSASLVPLAHWLASLIATTKTQQYTDVAQIAVAMQFFNIVLFIPTVLNKLILPRFIRNHRDSVSRRSIMKATLQQTGWYLLGVPVFPLLGLAFSTQLIQIYGFEETVIPIIMYFMWASVIAAGAIPVANYLVSQAYMGFALASNIAWTAIYLGGAIILPGGSAAVAISLFAAYITNLLVGLLFILIKESRSA